MRTSVFKNGISRVAYRFESVRRRTREMGETGWRDFSKESGKRERKVCGVSIPV